MKKVAFIALVATMGTSAANAGLLDVFGFGKKAEPTTLAEACDTAEIKKVCPEVVLGTKTITECLSENVKLLSKQCATFVKKSVADKAAAVKQGAADKKAESEEQKVARQQAIEDKKNAVKEKVASVKASVAEKKAADKAAAAAKKAEAKEKAAAQKAAIKAAGKDIADAVHETGVAAKETGAALKDIM